MPELALASYHGGELDGILKGLVKICKYHQLSWGSQMNIGIYHLLKNGSDKVGQRFGVVASKCSFHHGSCYVEGQWLPTIYDVPLAQAEGRRDGQKLPEVKTYSVCAEVYLYIPVEISFTKWSDLSPLCSSKRKNCFLSNPCEVCTLSYCSAVAGSMIL